jgi:hypothetical protein
LGVQHRWAATPKRFGNELDTLAVDAAGRLLVIEVKPGSPTPALAWTPCQVAVYTRLTRAWVEQDPSYAREVVEGMLHQRGALGLNGSAPALGSPIEIVPVIAVGLPVQNPKVAIRRFQQVQDALWACGEFLDDELEVWGIDADGQLVATGAGSLAELLA